MQGVWCVTPVKGLFDPKGVDTHMLRTAVLGDWKSSSGTKMLSQGMPRKPRQRSSVLSAQPPTQEAAIYFRAWAVPRAAVAVAATEWVLATSSLTHLGNQRLIVFQGEKENKAVIVVSANRLRRDSFYYVGTISTLMCLPGTYHLVSTTIKLFQVNLVSS